MTLEVNTIKPAQTKVFQDFSKTETDKTGHALSKKNYTAISIAAAAGLAAFSYRRNNLLCTQRQS